MDENKPRRRWLSFGIRDLLWAMVVVGLVIGWWMDQDRIRRQSEALKAAAQRLQALSVREAQKSLEVAEAELATMNDVKRRSPGAISESEFRRVELQADAAMIELEKARAIEEYGPTYPPNAKNSK